MQKIKHIPRNEPQLNQEIPENSNFNYELKSTVGKDRPVQVERVKDLKKQEKRLIKARQNTYRPLVVDQDFYLVDGHHRLDALTELDINLVRVFQVEAPIEQIVSTFALYRDNTPTYIPAVEEVVVTGTRATLQSAVDKQMMADNLISVVTHALGNFPITA